MDKVKRAITNVFKEEEGRTVTDITVDTITVAGFREVTYNYEVEGDKVVITNKLGSTVYEKSIRSYQDLNVIAIINK
ncbi:MAG: hypothetical protein J6D47_21105 [Peptostreptococcaceae bacterium]|nr:hypothetical protein [Peptostreptococcaceae bacterium]